MSFGFSIGDFIAVLQLANKVRKNFVGAPDQFKDVSNEVRSLSIVLHDVDIYLSECELSAQQETQLRDISASCRSVLEKLEQTLAKYVELDSANGILKTRAKKAWKRLQWEPDEIRELRGRITAHLTLLNPFLGGIFSQVVSTTKKGVDRLNQHRDDQERVAIGDWLTPVEYGAQQQDLYSRRQPGTGQWLLDSTAYQTWRDTQGQMLFCPGIPGAGKTMLTAIAIEDLTTFYNSQTPGKEVVGIAFVYCNFRRRDEQTEDQLLANVLKQLSRQRPSLPEPLRELWAKHRERQMRPSSDEISRLLRLTASSFSRLFIVVDAVDECQASEGCRARFLAEIRSMQKELGANVFATSRFIPEIVDHFRSVGSVTLEISASRADVERYIDGNMGQLPAFVRRNLKLQADIKDSISAAVDGMFLLAYVYLRSLEDKATPKAIRRALQQFTRQGQGSSSEGSKVQILSRAYDYAMERIDGQSTGFRNLALKVLSWITCAKRPLTVAELQHALAVEIGEPELDNDNIPEVEAMVSVCAGLVTVDDESSIIRLVHYTAQEYLERKQDLWFPDAETEITSVCVAYLSFRNFESGFCQTHTHLKERLRSNPFYSYAARYWGDHARNAASSESSTYQKIADFAMRRNLVEAASQVLGLTLTVRRSLAVLGHESYVAYGRPVQRQTTGLHLAAYFGLASVVKILLEKGCDPDAEDTYRRTPLMWAANCGWAAVVELLLLLPDVTGRAIRVDVNRQDWNGQTALSLAAQTGDERVVRLLLSDKSVLPDMADNARLTPLWYAMASGNDAAVAALLETGRVDTSSANSKRYSGWPPLCWAVKSGREKLVELLLAGGVDPDQKDRWRWTPLLRAAKRGHEAIATLLIATNRVELDARDRCGLTPLARAAAGGHAGLVKLLLSTSQVQVNAKDALGRTPLSWAARFGHVEVVALLLAAECVDPGVHDNEGNTPLLLAAEEGYDEVARLLLSHRAVDPNKKNRYGETPLQKAVYMGHRALVSLLEPLTTTALVEWTEETLYVPEC